MIPRSLAFAFAALLAACTALKATYNNLDWVVDWQIGRYVDLEPQQKLALDESFREVWNWHRGTQLKLYVADLRELAAKADRPFTRAQVEDYYERATGHFNRAVQGALPNLARLLKGLDDEQVRELLDNIAQKRERGRDKANDLGPEGVKDQSERNMLKNLKRFTGPLDSGQKARVHRWAQERQYAGPQGFQYQEAWARSFGELLGHRREPGFEQRLKALFHDVRQPPDPMMARLQAANRRNWIAMASDLAASLDERQRRHLREALLAFAADLETLSGDARTEDGGGQ